MTKQELEKEYIIVDGMVFTPRYDYEVKNVVDELTGETKIVYDFKITATAQTVYDEYLSQKNEVPIPSFEERSKIIENEQSQFNIDIDYRLSKLELGI